MNDTDRVKYFKVLKVLFLVIVSMYVMTLLVVFQGMYHQLKAGSDSIQPIPIKDYIFQGKSIASKIFDIYRKVLWDPGIGWKTIMLLVIGSIVICWVWYSIKTWKSIKGDGIKAWNVIKSVLVGFSVSLRAVIQWVAASFKWIVALLLLLVALLGVGQIIEWGNGVYLEIVKFKTSVQRVIDGQEKLKQLKATVRNLSNSNIAAKLEVIRVESDGNATVKLTVLDQTAPNPEKTPLTTKEFTLQDSDIYLDFYVLNFEYSEIGEGLRNNIAVPYRIYSSSIPAANGILLVDNDKTPIFFYRDENSVYGIDLETYKRSIKELSSALTDTELGNRFGILKQRERTSVPYYSEDSDGIRSTSGSAVHRPFLKGDKYWIRVNNQGGISLTRAGIL